MDLISVLGLVIGTALSAAALAVSVYGLEEARRTTLIRAVKTWIWKAFALLIVCNSAYGIFAFGTGAGPATRGAILMLMVHALNIVGIGFIVFLEATAKALEERATKRAALEASIEELKSRFAEAAPTAN